MPARQRKTKRRRVTGAPATTQDPPDNCVALKPYGRRKNHGEKLGRPSAPAPRRTALRIIYKSPNELKPRRGNPRTHDTNQVKQIAASIKEFGFVNPVLIDGMNAIVAGHARVESAKLLGMTDIPTVCVDHFTPAQVRAYVIADNRLAELAGWDRALLAIELHELSVEPNFDVTVTGFETAQIDLLINEIKSGQQDEADGVPPVDRSAPAVSRPGDLWRMGNHFLYCGNALNSGSFSSLLGKRKARLAFTDPPYNVQILGNVSGLGKVKHREFAMASGEMTSPEYTNFLKVVFTHLTAFTINGSMHFICNDWRHVTEVLHAASTTYTEQKNLCVWTKTNAGMGSLYRSQHELIFVFKNGTAKHVNNVKLGRFGRNRTNVWSYPGVNSFGGQRDAEIAMRPTIKPIRLIADAILDCSGRRDIVLDAFAGVGTTLIAAEQTGRRGYGIEIDHHYVDAAIQRIDKVCGLKAIHVESKLNFDQLKTERSEVPRHG